MGPPSFRPLAGRADSRVLRGRPARWVGSPRFRRVVASAASLAPRCRLAGVLRVGWVRRSFAALPPAPPRGLLVGAPCAGRVRKGLAALPPAPRRGSLISFTSFPSRFVASCLVWIPIAPSWSSLEGRLAGPPPPFCHTPPGNHSGLCLSSSSDRLPYHLRVLSDFVLPLLEYSWAR